MIEAETSNSTAKSNSASRSNGVARSSSADLVAAAAVEDVATQSELLSEAARRQQQEARAMIDQLAAVARDLEHTVRQEIRSALVEEFEALGDVSHRAVEALGSVRRAASVRIALWAVAVVSVCSMIPVAVAWSVLPSRAELARVRAERDRLEASVALLERRGGNVDLRRCGPDSRLCVRIERAAPAYGAQADYLIVKGY
jgi:hypothetical protein